MGIRIANATCDPSARKIVKAYMAARPVQAPCAGTFEVPTIHVKLIIQLGFSTDGNLPFCRQLPAESDFDMGSVLLMRFV